MNLKYFTLLLTIVISFVIIFPASDILAQGLRIEDVPGGSGSSGSSSSNSSDNSTLYIVGGAIIAGIVVYALLRKNSDKKKDKSDSSEVSLNEKLKFSQTKTAQLQTIKNQIPVDIYFGMSNESAFISEKKYSFGLSFRF